MPTVSPPKTASGAAGDEVDQRRLAGMTGAFVDLRIMVGGAQDLPAGKAGAQSLQPVKGLHRPRPAGAIGDLARGIAVQQRQPARHHGAGDACMNGGPQRGRGELDEDARYRVERPVPVPILDPGLHELDRDPARHGRQDARLASQKVRRFGTEKVAHSGASRIAQPPLCSIKAKAAADASGRCQP